MAADILVVDDEADIRDLVSGILEDEGHHVRTARGSDEALEAIRQRNPTLVVLDVWLQGSRIDGLDLLQLFKEVDPDLPVIVISGHGTIETAVTAIRQGAYDFIEKPFTADRLLVVVQRALETAKLKREKRRAAHARGGELRSARRFRGHGAGAQCDRQNRADKFARADLRRGRLRQGIGCATDSRSFGTRRFAIHRHQRRLDGA